MANGTVIAILWAQFIGGIWGILLVRGSGFSGIVGLAAFFGAYGIAWLARPRRDAQDREG